MCMRSLGTAHPSTDVPRCRTCPPRLHDPGGPQLIGDACHHDPWHEEQAPLEPQRGLVVQELLPPTPDHVLRDVDGDDVPRAALAHVLYIPGHRADQLSVR